MSTATQVPTDFLLARIAEDEAVIVMGLDDPADGPGSFDPERLLTECEAKRQTIRDWQKWEAVADKASDEDDLSHSQVYLSGIAKGLGLAVENLLEVYADHSDYPKGWCA